MIDQPDIITAISQFLARDKQKVLLLIGEVKSSLGQIVDNQLHQLNVSFVHINFYTKPNVEELLLAVPVGKPVVILFEGFKSNKRLENIHIKYQLSRWSAKVIAVCPHELLHPRFDPCLYFAPLQGKSIQKRLVTIMKIKPMSTKKQPHEVGTFFTQRMPKGSVSVYYQRLRLHFLNQRLMTNDIAMMQFFASRVAENIAFKDLCLQFVYASSYDAIVAIAAANAITILKFAGISFAQMDLHNTCLAGANLANANLDHANLEGADLTNVILQQAWLRYANLRGARLGNIILGENPYFTAAQKVSSICFSPDGKWLISAENTEIVIWDVVTKQRNKVISGHTLEITTLDHHPFEPIIVSGSVDQTINVWHRETGQLLHTISRKIFPEESWRNVVDKVCFSPDGMTLASADKEVCLWDARQFKLLAKIEDLSKDVSVMQFDPKGQELICGNDDGNIYIWNIEKRQVTNILHGNQVKIASIAVSPDAKWIAAGDQDNRLYLWDKSSLQLKALLQEHRDKVSALDFSADSCFLASGGWDQIICIWEVESGQLRQIIKGHASIVNSVQYQPTGKFLVSCSNDKTIRWWDINQPAISSVDNVNSELQRGWIKTIKFSPNNNLLATGCAVSNEITLRDVRTGLLKNIIRGHTLEVSAIQFSREGEWLVSGSYDNSVCWWHRKTGKPGRVFQLPDFVIADMQYRTNGELLVAGNLNETACVIEANSGQIIINLTAHTAYLQRLFCGHNLELYIFWGGKEIYLWDITKHCFYGSIKHIGVNVTAIELTSDGKLLALADQNGSLYLWSVEHLNHMATLQGHRQEISDIGFSTDDQLLASVSWDQTIIIWDVKQKQILCKLETTVAITSVCFNDTHQLVIGCLDSSVQCWRRLENTNHWSLAWSSHSLPLSCQGSILNDAIDLAESARNVMQQKGAINDANTYCAEEKPVLAQRLSG